VSNDSFSLVTGAAGFIGSNLTQSLLERGRNVIAIDCFLPDLYSAELKRRRWHSLIEPKNCKLIRVDFDLRTDNFDEINQYPIDSIFHQAAMPGLIDNWQNSKIYYECNLYALHRLLEYSRQRSLTSFVHASTSSVYGRVAEGGENQELKPISPYGVSKLAAEKLLQAYFEEYSIPIKILRYFSVYGPGQRPDMAYAKIISAIDSGNVFRIFGDGSQRRTNTFVGDIVEATVLAEVNANPGDIFNISGRESISLAEAIGTIELNMNRKLETYYVESRKGDQVQTSGNSSLAQDKLGWTPKTSFEVGIALQVSEYFRLKAHP
jgi:UDP-glucose 4-epimerase